MIFNVTYRDKSGEMKSLELDVPNKAAVWAELKKRGISAIAVHEGKASRASGGKSPSAVRGIVAGIAVVALAIGAWFFFKDGTPAPKDEGKAKPKRVREVKPAKPKSPKPAVDTNKVEKPAPVTVAETKVEPEPEAPKPNPRLAPSTAKKYPRRVIPRKPEPPQKFKYDSDDLIGGFLEITPGDQIEGGLRFDKIGRDFEKSLTEDVALAEGQDNEYNRQLREQVREIKKEIQKIMREENKTFGQVMQEQFDQLIEMGQYKRDLEQELRKIRKSGEYTAEEYDKFIEGCNKMLENKGCSHLKVPKATYYQLERYRKMREAKEAEAAANGGADASGETTASGETINNGENKQ